MRYLSVCSGIEAASVAWEPIGWEPAAFAEIEAFPSAVLAERFPGVPNLGDITKFTEWPDLGTVDLVCGGTPCQSFSVAGLRAGLADPRGNLCLTYLAIVDRYRPRWTVWENVPGVLSSDGGRDFGAFLGGLGQLGYGWCYRVLDAQYVRVDGFPGAVPQRRRRLFVVGYSGDWRRAAAVLSERQSLQGYHPPRRQAGQGAAHDVAPSLTGSGGGVERPGESRGQDPLVASLVASTGDVSHCLNAGGMGRQDYETETMVAHAFRNDAGRDGEAKTPSPDAEGRIRLRDPGFNAYEELAPTLDSSGPHTVAHALDACSAGRATEDGTGRGVPLVAHTLRANFDAGEDGTGRGTPLVAETVRSHPRPGSNSLGGVVASPLMARSSRGGGQTNSPGFQTDGQIVAFHPTQDPISSEGVTHAMGTGSEGGSASIAVAFDLRNGSENEASMALQAGGMGEDRGRCINALPHVASRMAIRRLMPVECERLQGFPDGWTDVPYRGKPAADGPRYKALGNSMAVNCMRWIGRRIEMVEALS